MGLDLGQRRDHTAVAVVERAEPSYGRVATGRCFLPNEPQNLLKTGTRAFQARLRDFIPPDTRVDRTGNTTSGVALVLRYNSVGRVNVKAPPLTQRS